MIKLLSKKNFNQIIDIENQYGFLTPKQLNDMLNSYNYLSYGWFNKNILVGYLIATKVIDNIDIITILVIPKYRKQQIATKLMEKLIKQNNNCKIHIEVSSENKSAINLYKKFKFKPIHIRKKYYQSKDDAIYMTLQVV